MEASRTGIPAAIITALLESPTVTNNMSNNFSFDHSGETEVFPEWSYGRIGLAGGCHPGEGIGLIFQDNTGVNKESWFMVSMEGDDAPGSGETGTYSVDEVKWFNGHRRDPDIGVTLPIIFEGSGRLDVTRHSGRGMAGRMAGALTADVANEDSGEPASIELTFDINYACAG